MRVSRGSGICSWATRGATCRGPLSWTLPCARSWGYQQAHGNKVRLGELFDRLVQYRNRELGHGAAGMRPDPSYYARMGRVMLSGVAEILGRLDVLAGRRLVYIAAVAPPEDRQLSHRTICPDGRVGPADRVAGTARRGAQHLPLPEQVYVEGPGDRPPSSVAPLMTYDPQRDDVLFLNASRERQRIEYLSYTTGDHLFRHELGGRTARAVVPAAGGPDRSHHVRSLEEPSYPR